MAKEQKEKVQISIAQVLADLENGIDRKQMQDKYGLSRADIIRLFRLPELKGKKVKREVEPGFVIVDSEVPTANTSDSTETNAATNTVSDAKSEW